MPSLADAYYQRGLRRIARTPSEKAATPTAEELTLNYVAGKAAEQERAKSVASGLALKKRGMDTRVAMSEADRKSKETRTLRDLAHSRTMAKTRLAQEGRAFDESAALERSTLRDAKKAGKIATGIQVANLGVQGLGAKVALQQAEKQELFDEQMIQRLDALSKTRETAIQEIIGILRQQTEMHGGTLPYLARETWGT